MALESYEGLRQMIDTVNRVTRQLQVMGSPIQHWDHFLVHLVISRMAPRSLSAWETMQDLREMPHLDAVLRFLSKFKCKSNIK